jgi:hydrogenase nickel incorporation protein HypA/HybF
MHEMAITQSIVELCEQHAAGKRINHVVIEIGTLSGVVPEAVQFCFSACTLETTAAGATLEIRILNGEGECLDCGTVQPVETLFAPCANCGSFAISITAGQEMRLHEIEVDD